MSKFITFQISSEGDWSSTEENFAKDPHNFFFNCSFFPVMLRKDLQSNENNYQLVS